MASAFDLLHRGVQQALWRMDWKELRPLQVEAIQHLLGGDGRHLILAASTASGKTEAAFLPIVSSLASQPEPSVQAVYVGPLKALINDQFARLETLCQDADIPVHRWHGDVPASQKKRFRERPGGILLITPESLESNFVNFGLDVPRLYRHLRFVVIDELHSFLDNVRGVHLRSLLHRLQVQTGAAPVLVGLSATLGDPQAAQRWLSPDKPESVRVHQDASAQRTVKLGVRAYLSRPPAEREEVVEPRLTVAGAARFMERLAARPDLDGEEYEAFAAELLGSDDYRGDLLITDELDEIAEDILVAFSDSTNLVFLNARTTIEDLADRLHGRVAAARWSHDPFVVHHGSISKELREETESRLKAGTPTTALCSSTLEMGIDIGNARAIGQVDPPWSVSSLVQRLGRSGRREGEPSILRLYVREESPGPRSSLTDLLCPDLLRAIAMIRLMVARWLEPADVDRWHLSTLVHQILSVLRQTGGQPAAGIHQLLVAGGAFRRVGTADFAVLLRGLGENQIIEQMPNGDLILAPAGEKITAHHSFYAAFQSSEEMTIRHEDHVIGQLPGDLIPPIGEHFLLAGRRWRVVDISTESATVFVVPAKGKKATVFKGEGGDIHTRIVQEMRQVLLANDVPSYLDEAARTLLEAARRMAAATRVVERGFVSTGTAFTWYPWIGTCGLRTLELLGKRAKLNVARDRLSLRYKASADDMRAHLQQIVNEPLDSLELAALMKPKTRDRFDDLVPDELLDRANADDRLDIEEARKAAMELLTAL